MDAFKMIGIGLIGAVAATVVKPQKGEIALQISMITGILILIGVSGELTEAVGVFTGLSQQLGSDSTFITTVLKVIGIAYSVEFASGVCRDAGQTAIATKLELAGKVLIFVLCAPMILTLMESITSML